MTDEPNPYEPPRSGADGTPRPELAPAGPAYSPWKQPRIYAAFVLGTTAAELMFAAFHPVFAAIGLGCGIPAVILANKEAVEHPEAATHGFVVWGRRCGWIGIIIGAIAIVVWIVVLALGVGFSL